MELTLSNAEQAFLLEMLEERHRELLEEIAHTDRREYKEELRKNEKLLESLVSRVRRAAELEFQI